MLVETKARVGVFAIAWARICPSSRLVPEFEQQHADFKKDHPQHRENRGFGGIVTTKELSMAAGDVFPRQRTSIWSFCSC